MTFYALAVIGGITVARFVVKVLVPEWFKRQAADGLDSFTEWLIR